jgi:hypothetical protein
MLNVPKSLKLMSASEVSNSVRRREKITLYATNGQKISGISSGGDIIEFKIPASTNSVDMSTFFIHGTIQINKSVASSTAFLHDSIESIIEELTITIGNNSQQIENIKHYNRLESALQPYCSGDFANSFGGSCMGLGLSISERKSLYNNFDSVDGKVVSFSIPLRFSGVSNPAISIMPGNVFNQSSFMMVRIKLAPASSCICAYTSTSIELSDATTPVLSGGARTAISATYTLDNLRATVDMVETSNEYQQMMQEFLASQSLQYPIQTFDINVRNLPANQVSHIETLTLQYKNIDALLFFFNLSSELKNFLFCGEDRLSVPSVGGVEVIKSLQLKINGVNVPNSAINLEYGASEALCHTVEALGMLHYFENNGGLNFQKSNTCHYVSSVGTCDRLLPLYNEVTSNRFYGRMKRKCVSANDSSLATAAGPVPGTVQLEDTSNVKIYTNVATGAGSFTLADTPEINPYLNDLSPSSFVIGVNLRKLLDLEPEVLSGSNLQSTSGGITYEIQYTTGTNVPAYELGIACLHTRFINFTPSGANVDF